MLIGEILRQLFIIRPDGSVDHDMVVELAQAEKLHSYDKDQSREPAIMKSINPQP